MLRKGTAPNESVAPTVTVVVCAYRQVTHLATALRGALGQTYHDFKVVVSDDSASPEIQALCDSLADSRIAYVPRIPSLGIASNHWQTFGETTTPYISVLNHDDAWEPEFLSDLVAALDGDPSASLAFCDHWLIDNDDNVLPEATERNSEQYGRASLPAGSHTDGLRLALANTVPLAMGAVFRRSCLDLDRFDPAVGGAYDQWTSYCLGRGGRTFQYVAKRLTRYRVHEESATARHRQTNLEGAIYIVEQELLDPACSAFRAILRERKASFLRSLAAEKRAQGQKREARADLIRSLRTQPSFRSLIRLLTP